MRRFHYLCLAALLVCNTALAADLTCKPPSGGSDWTAWLKKQESAGGHAISCHINKNEQALVNRITEAGGNKSGVCMSNGSIASSWSSDADLIKALKEAMPKAFKLVGNGVGIITTAGPDKSSADKIGTIVEKKSGSDSCKTSSLKKDFACKKATKWVVVVKRTASDCFLLTAYPN